LRTTYVGIHIQSWLRNRWSKIHNSFRSISPGTSISPETSIH